jgi:hypothetical protein
VDFSKLKLELYDFLGLILPGLIAICEGWISLRGWHTFVVGMGQIGGTGLTLFVVFAFGIGNIIQELGDVTLKAIKGQRYFRSSRDRFWQTTEAEVVREAIKKSFGQDIPSVDTAFNYCLTKLRDRFGKRDIFLATSDLCRSFVVLSGLALVPVMRIAFYDPHPLANSFVAAAILIAMLVTVSVLAWRRMLRFRALSDTTVFRAYLAIVNEAEIEAHPRNL